MGVWYRSSRAEHLANSWSASRQVAEENEISGFRIRNFRHGRAVDWITQAALGASMGELILGKRLGKSAMTWGALFGVLPEFDGIFSLILDRAHQLALHTGPSHSLWFMALLAYGLSYPLEKLWKREKISKLTAAGFVFAILCGHLFLECLTVKGASVFWPFVIAPFALNLIYPFDLILSGLLVVTAIWMAFLPEAVIKKTRSKKPNPPPKRRKIFHWGLGLAAAYIGIAGGVKWISIGGIEADLLRRKTTYHRWMEAPTLGNPFLRRAVVDCDDEIRVGYRTIFESNTTPVRWTIYPKDRAALAGVADAREIKTLIRATNGWWIARTNAKGVWLGDMRPEEARNWGDKKGMVDSRLARSWTFTLDAKGDRLRQTNEAWRNTADTLNRISYRIMGNTAMWEANPRLAGIPGSLPEFLPSQE